MKQRTLSRSRTATILAMQEMQIPGAPEHWIALLRRKTRTRSSS